MTDPIDLPIDKDKFDKLAAERERQWRDEVKPLWDVLNAQFPVDYDNDK